ncbi:hypothetical protein N2K95_15160 [Arthrobacter zhaoxinii]|uniref:Uncharacterized protein n=1 Tax=Arthrobacter zhaoxinii TaxID=2964616 RepID=A0ABY5YPD5_9MICC|nr:hypothetical protein [Arthrobacter zhaoxinii]UWX96952.1 hypothetical protein N2K95_15160 [Arthrobacter zhaoxinii]
MKTSRSYLIAMASVFLLLGFVLGGLYLWLDLNGFVGGMFTGASVMLMICGVYVLVRYVWWGRGRNGADRADWLPSRERTDKP